MTALDEAIREAETTVESVKDRWLAPVEQSPWDAPTDLLAAAKQPAPHVIECNVQNGPLGAPGCLCVVVNRNLISPAPALPEAVVEAAAKARAAIDREGGPMTPWGLDMCALLDAIDDAAKGGQDAR